MHTAFISFKSSHIHYSYSDPGNRLLLCLHGYGESEHSFHFLEKHLPPGYCLLAVDLPLHGKTQWKEGVSLSVADLLQIIQSILIKQSWQEAPLTLLGFSMGGRIALRLLQEIPEKIERLILLAPDGLKVNGWYWLATQSSAGNTLFRFTMQHPGWLFFLMQVGKGLGIINYRIYKFIRHFLSDKTLRKQLYLRWTCMRYITPNLDRIKKIIQQYQIPVRLLYGRYDPIILPARGEKFRHGIESFCTLQVIESGHQLLQESHAGIVIESLQS